MAESAFLTAVEAHLGAAGLTPAPTTLGIAEPEKAADLPAVVLSLEATQRLGSGLGERAVVMTGALAWQATIDLANPVLPEDTTVLLLDAARKVLLLPHGGLVRADGSDGTLGPADVTVSVGGVSRPVVTGAPVGNQVVADGIEGKLTFATALPATGKVQVGYFIGQWERRVARIEGTLRVDVCAGNAVDAQSLSDRATAALLAGTGGPLPGLLRVGVASMSSTGPTEQASGNLRRRTVRFTFEYEQTIDRPDSSGGIIRKIPAITRLSVATVDPSTGAITTGLVTEVG